MKCVYTMKSGIKTNDTTVNGMRLIILTPHGATATLEVGNDVVKDTTVILAAQAADIRSDNGKTPPPISIT